MQAAENITHLASQENWKLEFIESHGSITQLVLRFFKCNNTALLTILTYIFNSIFSLMYLKHK